MATWIVLGLVLLAVIGVLTGFLSPAGGVGLAVGATVGLVAARARRRRA